MLRAVILLCVACLVARCVGQGYERVASISCVGLPGSLATKCVGLRHELGASTSCVGLPDELVASTKCVGLRDELIASANAAGAVKAEQGRKFYSDTFKPMALEKLREAAADGLFQTYFVLGTGGSTSYHWLLSIEGLWKDDTDFEGFHFTCYPTSEDELMVQVGWT